jgi:DNA polymerase I
LKILVDADIIVYRAASAAETIVDWGDTVQATGDKRECVQRMEADVQSYRDRFGGEVTLCLSDPDRCFRTSVLPSYKGDRSVRRLRPLLWRWAREHLHEHFTVEQWSGLEADDVLGILGTRHPESVVVTVDKDLLGVPCRQFNPGTGAERHPTVEEADRFHLVQTLMGDRVDHYFGLPGVGKKTAEKILGAAEARGTDDRPGANRWRLWEAVTRAYESRGFSRADALAQARVARILRDGEYNNGRVLLWDARDDGVQTWTE